MKTDFQETDQYITQQAIKAGISSKIKYVENYLDSLKQDSELTTYERNLKALLDKANKSPSMPFDGDAILREAKQRINNATTN